VSAHPVQVHQAQNTYCLSMSSRTGETPAAKGDGLSPLDRGGRDAQIFENLLVKKVLAEEQILGAARNSPD